jgi:hypothetical protein
MFGTALRYGAISGAIIVGVLIAGIVGASEHQTQSSIFSTEWFGYTVMLVALSTIFLAIRDYRNKNLGGVIKFLPALGLGLSIAFIAGLAYVIGWEIYLYATHYSFADHYAAAIIEQARQAGTSAEAAAAEAQSFKNTYANPLMRVPMTFLEIFPVGVLIALISAAVLRNPKVLPARA